MKQSQITLILLLTLATAAGGILWLLGSVAAPAGQQTTELVSPYAAEITKPLQSDPAHDRRVDTAVNVSTPDAHTTAAPTVLSWPETNDPATLLAVLQALAERQAAQLIAQGGWINFTVTGPDLHEANIVARSEEYRGPGEQSVPGEALFPVGNGVHSAWYQIDPSGLVTQGFTFTTDADGRIYQPSVLVDGAWINLALQANGRGAVTLAESLQVVSYLPIYDVILSLERALATAVDNDAEQLTVTAYRDGDAYHVRIRTDFATAIDLGPPMPLPVIAGERHAVFNVGAYSLQTEAHRFTLQNGDEFLAGVTEHHPPAHYPNPPEAVQQQLDAAVKAAGMGEK